MKAMWKLQDLQYSDMPLSNIESEWCPARPLNYTKKYCSLWRRLKYAWQVLNGTAETFSWPGNQ